MADPGSASTTVTMDSDKTVTANFVPDNDNDGVPDEEEQGPNGDEPVYDGNNDGTPDSEQDNVVSGHTYDEQYYVTLAVPDSSALSDAEALPVPAGAPADMDFPYGVFAFKVNDLEPDGTTTVTLYLPDDAAPSSYYKYGPTLDDPTDHWYEFLYDGETGAEINENVITLHFVDGHRGDDDLDADGDIEDAGGPGFTETSAADTTTTGGGSGGGGCFISTAARGYPGLQFGTSLAAISLVILLISFCRRRVRTRSLEAWEGTEGRGNEIPK